VCPQKSTERDDHKNGGLQPRVILVGFPTEPSSNRAPSAPFARCQRCNWFHSGMYCKHFCPKAFPLQCSLSEELGLQATLEQKKVFVISHRCTVLRAFLRSAHWLRSRPCRSKVSVLYSSSWGCFVSPSELRFIGVPRNATAFFLCRGAHIQLKKSQSINHNPDAQEVGTVCAMEFGKKTHFNQLQ